VAATYLPRNDSSLLVWLANFQSTLAAQAKVLSVGPTELKAALDGAKDLATAIQVDEQKYAEWQAAVAYTADQKKQALPEIQRIIDRLRVAPGFTDEHAKALMAVPPRPQATLVGDLKPAIRGSVVGGKVRLRWTRGSLDGIHVYGRKQGETAWQLLGRDNRPPYDDPRPLPAGSSVEVREYRVIGVVADEEVGQPSDIVTVTLNS
jgi:hypothetical protein